MQEQAADVKDKAKNKVNDDSYFTVHGWMSKLGLKGNELFVYAIIYGFSKDGAKFTGSRKYLADFINSTTRGVQKNINSLLEKEFIIKTEKIIKNIKYCEYEINPLKSYPQGREQSSLGVGNKVPRGREQSSLGVGNKVPRGREQSSPNNIYNNIYKYNNNISVCNKYNNNKNNTHTFTQQEYDYLVSKYKDYSDIVNLKIERAKQEKYKAACYNLSTIEKWIVEEIESNKSIANKEQSKQKPLNKFNNFNQRQYSKEEFAELERKLLAR